MNGDAAITAKGGRHGYWTRRLARNIGICAVASIVGMVAYYGALNKTNWAFRVSMATGYAAVFLLAWALALGPWRVLRGRSTPTSVDLRRDIGIWSALMALAHSITGLQVHMGGDMLRYFIFRPEDGPRPIPLRIDVFGITNWTGLAAAMLFLFLLFISNDRSLRRLGAKRWKRWQRWTYAAAVLTVLHGIAFQLMDKRTAPWIVVFASVIAAVVLLQLAGWQQLRGRAEITSRPVERDAQLP